MNIYEKYKKHVISITYLTLRIDVIPASETSPESVFLDCIQILDPRKAMLASQNNYILYTLCNLNYLSNQ